MNFSLVQRYTVQRYARPYGRTIRRNVLIGILYERFVGEVHEPPLRCDLINMDFGIYQTIKYIWVLDIKPLVISLGRSNRLQKVLI